MPPIKQKISIALRLFLFMLPLVGIVAGGCTGKLPTGTIAGQKTYSGSVDMKLNGFRRTYLVHVPPAYSRDAPLPLVVVIHGAFDTAAGMEKASGFSQLADREGFIVLYPNGMGIFGFFQHWNAGHCCGKAAEDKIDDVGFLAAAIDDVCSRLSIDRNRIFMTGFSNGGMLTYRFAAERGDMLAAAAPLAASIGGRAAAGAPAWRIPKPVRPLPLIVMHGLLDDDIRYEGGVSLHRGGDRTFLPVRDSVAFWVQNNMCRAEAEERHLHGDGILVKTWSSCQNGADVQLYLLKGWGHAWPGGEFTRSLPAENPIREFDAAATIWEYFRTHRRH